MWSQVSTKPLLRSYKLSSMWQLCQWLSLGWLVEPNDLVASITWIQDWVLLSLLPWSFQKGKDMFHPHSPIDHSWITSCELSSLRGIISSCREFEGSLCRSIEWDEVGSLIDIVTKRDKNGSLNKGIWGWKKHSDLLEYVGLIWRYSEILLSTMVFWYHVRKFKSEWCKGCIFVNDQKFNIYRL